MARITPKIFKEEQGAGEEKGENARLSSFIGAIAVADLVKSTLGPKGMDKILQSTSPDSHKKVVVTNDGATILRSIPIDNPAAKILVDTSKTQDEEVGDGTTSVAVLAGEFLRQAEELINQKIHPQTVIRGWRKAVDVAFKALEASSKDNSADQASFREDLLNIARTTLSSKVLNVDKDYFANMAVDAALRLRGSTDVSSIHILKKAGGSLRDSFLEEGFILDKKPGIGQPRRMENCKILLANTTLDTDKIKIWSARVRVESLDKVVEIENAEKKKLRTKVEKILKHNVNVFVNRQLIYDYPEQLFTESGIMAVEHADFEPLERLALVTGGEIVSTFDHPEDVKLGTCDVIEEITIGEDRVLRFGGCPNGAACTIVLRGSSSQLLDEAERSMHDALCVLSQTIKTSRVVLGGGCSEMLMAVAVENLAKTVPGKESLAIEGFAKALRAIPSILADNAGYDSSDLVTRLRAAHHSGQTTAGLDMNKGTLGDMVTLKITESFKCKSQVLISSHEAAEMIVRVDEIIRTAPRKREDPHGR